MLRLHIFCWNLWVRAGAKRLTSKKISLSRPGFGRKALIRNTTTINNPSWAFLSQELQYKGMGRVILSRLRTLILLVNRVSSALSGPFTTLIWLDIRILQNVTISSITPFNLLLRNLNPARALTWASITVFVYVTLPSASHGVAFHLEAGLPKCLRNLSFGNEPIRP